MRWRWRDDPFCIALVAGALAVTAFGLALRQSTVADSVCTLPTDFSVPPPPVTIPW